VLSGPNLCSRLPHRGSMCLLDAVVVWDRERIHCTASSHRLPTNPLRNASGLPAVSGVEYATQAMALHASLIFDDSAPRAGYLAGLRDLALAVDWLHDIGTDLDVFAALRSSDGRGAIYEFHLEANRSLLLSGRATVVYSSLRSVR